MMPTVSLESLNDMDHDFLNTVEKKYMKYLDACDNVEIKDGLKISMEISSLGNKYLQDSRFWEKEKIESKR